MVSRLEKIRDLWEEFGKVTLEIGSSDWLKAGQLVKPDSVFEIMKTTKECFLSDIKDHADKVAIWEDRLCGMIRKEHRISKEWAIEVENGLITEEDIYKLIAAKRVSLSSFPVKRI